MSVFQVHDDADEDNVVQRKCVANVVFLLIPKIIATITNIALDGNTIGEPLIVVGQSSNYTSCLLLNELRGSVSYSVVLATVLWSRGNTNYILM